MNIDGRVKPNVQRLKELRRAYGISQEGLADLCMAKTLRVSVSSIKRAEAGKNLLYRTIRDLAQFFSVDISELIIEENEQEKEQERLFDSKIPIYFLIIEVTNPHYYWQIIHFIEKMNLTHFQWEQNIIISSPNQERNVYLRQTIELLVKKIQLLSQNQVKIFLFSELYTLKTPLNDPIQTVFFYLPHWQATVTSLFQQIRQGDVVAIEFIFQLGLYPVGEIIKKVQFNKNNIYFIEQQKTITSLLGRELEINYLQLLLSEVLKYRKGICCQIYGIQGIGKSYLGQYFLSLAKKQLVPNIYIDFTLQGHQDVEERYFIACLLSCDDKNQTQIKQQLNDLLQHSPLYQLVLFDILGFQLTTIEQQQLQQYSVQQLTKIQEQAFQACIQHYFDNRPCIILLDHIPLHYYKVWQFIQLLVRYSHTLPLLILILSRTTEESSLNTHWSSSIRSFELTPLKTEDYQHFIETIPIHKALKQHITKDSYGHPLYLEQGINQKLWGETDYDIDFSYGIKKYYVDFTVEDIQILQIIAVYGVGIHLNLLRDKLQIPHYQPTKLIHCGLIKEHQALVQMSTPLITQIVVNSIDENRLQELRKLCRHWFGDHIVLRNTQDWLDTVEANVIYHLIVVEAEELVADYQYFEALELIDQIPERELLQNFEELYYLKAKWLYCLGYIETSLKLLEQGILAKQEEPISYKLQIKKLQIYILKFKQFTPNDNKKLLRIENQYIDKKKGQNYFLQALIAYQQLQFTTSIELFKKQLYWAKREQEYDLQKLAYWGISSCYFWLGNMQLAYDHKIQGHLVHSSIDLFDVDALQQISLLLIELFVLKIEDGLQICEAYLKKSYLFNHLPSRLCILLVLSWYCIDRRYYQQSLNYIKEGLQLTEQINNTLFTVLFYEAKARALQYSHNEQAKVAATHAVNIMKQQQLTPYSGAWIYSTLALVTQGGEQEKWLEMAKIQIKTTIRLSINDYFYYLNSIQIAWQHKDAGSLRFYLKELTQYHQLRYSPWLELLIKQVKQLYLMIEKLHENNTAKRQEHFYPLSIM